MEQVYGNKYYRAIPNKENSDIYCIYTNYENDFNGLYTTILGCKVNSFDNLPNDFFNITIPSTKYQVYKSIGKLPDCVVTTWSAIWQSNINRKYVADFDVYGQKAHNKENAEVHTYVSIAD